MTERNYKFAEQYDLPFIFVSAADGTNVVKTFKEAITRGLKHKRDPPEDYFSTVLNMLKEVGVVESRMTSSMRKRKGPQTSDRYSNNYKC